MARTVQFDVDSITLGEMFAAERASGTSFAELNRTTAGRMLIAVFVLRLRSSGQPPIWSELTNLRMLDASSSLLASEPASPGQKSSD